MEKKIPFTGERDDRFFNDRDDRIIFGTLFQNLHEKHLHESVI